MKIKKLHLFLILFMLLLLCTVTCCNGLEGYSNKQEKYNKKGKDNEKYKDNNIFHDSSNIDNVKNPLLLDEGDSSFESSYNPSHNHQDNSSYNHQNNLSQDLDENSDLYILKSQIVPPVCPACPSNTCPRKEKCPPCPPCERCPEPAFECKKVPNYSSGNNQYLPKAVLNSFSQFGS